MNERMLSSIMLSVCILFGAIAQILFKMGMSQVQGGSFFDILSQLIRTPQLVIGTILYGTSFVLWLLALRYFDVSFMYPLLSLAYILVVFMSVLVLNETVHLTRWIGVILIVIGAILVGLNK